MSLSFAFIVVIIGFLAYVASRPSEFRVTRSAVMTAPPSAPFAQVNDLHNWNAWSPWAKMDPNSKSTFEGAPAGVGSSLAWSGNKKVGAGKMTIMESKPNELIRIKLEFFKPFKGLNTVDFTFRPEGNQTEVTWDMYGKSNFIGKLMNIFMNCEDMIGRQYDQGLAAIKAIVEQR